MKKKIILRISYLIIFFFIALLILYLNSKDKKKIVTNETTVVEEENYTTSNILKNVKYSAKDINGNQLMIEALGGEIDSFDKNIIFLTDVKATIILTNSETIAITSKFGKYNINNFDTIFSKNVIINYINNKITGDYLDFSLERNSLIASKNIIYKNDNNILKADIITMDLKTKDIKIQMYENKKKVNIKTN
tara:strand:+ start:1525 stop:2100 length:576 start_codon:yes stop_codon:yes gene_type:complete